MSESDHTGVDTHLAALDLLRGVAILAVLAYHLFLSVFPSGWWHAASWIGPVGTWATNGWMGVNLFFILSGFVLYFPFAAGRRRIASVADAVRFYKRRAMRLLPLFYVSTLILIGISSHPWPRQELQLLTLTFNFNADTFLPTQNFVLWSLGIEIWFSVLFPLLVAALNRFGWLPIAVIVFASSLAARWVAAPTSESIVGHSVPFINLWKDSLLGRIDDFFVGMLLAAAYARGMRFPFPRSGFVAGLLVCTGAALIVDGVVTGSLPWPIFALSNTVFQLGLAIMLPAMLAMSRLRAYPLELAGMMCYSIYIWHGAMLKHVGPDPHTLAGLARYLGLLAGIAWLSYRYVEFGHVKSVGSLLPMHAVPTRPPAAAPPPTNWA